MRARERGVEGGQVLVVFALALFFVLVSAAAVAIDLGNGHLQKRRLQSAADAAALAGAVAINDGQNGVVAAKAILNNSGITTASYGTNPPTTNVGSGTGLTMGIEATSSSGIRVALQRDVSTYLTGMMGVSEIGVAARAHAKAASIGVLPVAIKRWSEGDTRSLLGVSPNPTTVYDYLGKKGTVITPLDEITAWPSPLTHDAINPAERSEPDSYNPTKSGRVFAFLGSGAEPNTSQTANFHFWIMPDVRDITNPAGASFYGMATPSNNAQQLKNISSSYFSGKGYPGPYPLPGDQVATLFGVNTGQALSELRKVYQRGDVVTAMVYDGTVYSKPSFNLEVIPETITKTNININSTYGNPSHAALFNVRLTPLNGFASPIDGVEFSASGLKRPSPADPTKYGTGAVWANWTFNSVVADDALYNKKYPTLINSAGPTNVPFYVYRDNSNQVVGARSFQVRAKDQGGKVVKMVSGSVVANHGSPPTYSITSPEAYKITKQGDGALDFDVRTWSYNGYSNNSIQVLGYDWFVPSSATDGEPEYYNNSLSGVNVSWPGSVRVVSSNNKSQNTFKVTLDVTSTAPTGEWLLRLRLTNHSKWYEDTANEDVQYIYLAVQINTPDSVVNPATTSDFVYVLGYANFIITNYDNSAILTPSKDSNTQYAYAIGPMKPTPDQLQYGLKPRLVGWFQ